MEDVCAKLPPCLLGIVASYTYRGVRMTGDTTFDLYDIHKVGSGCMDHAGIWTVTLNGGVSFEVIYRGRWFIVYSYHTLLDLEDGFVYNRSSYMLMCMRYSSRRPEWMNRRDSIDARKLKQLELYDQRTTLNIMGVSFYHHPGTDRTDTKEPWPVVRDRMDPRLKLFLA